MVPEPSPKCVGLEFVRQYYTVLNKAPACLHRFYSNDSKFLHSGEVVMGQTDIHKKILSLGFNDCHAKIQLVDAFSTLGDGVLIQVTGELSNNGMPLRKFTQSIVLAPQSPKKYYVHSDIFHYIDELFTDDSVNDETVNDIDDEPEIVAKLDENFVGNAVNGSIHEQQDIQSHVPMETISQVAPESNYSVNTSGMKNPPPAVSPIPHINPHMGEALGTQRTPNTVNEDLNDDDVCQDEWQNDSPPMHESPVKLEEEIPKVEEPEKIPPQPVISNEPKTYANLLKNNASFPSSSTQHVNHFNEPAINNNHITKPRPEPRTFTKPLANDSASASFQKTSSSRHFQADDERRRFLMPDSHQVFVGNLPHTISDDELKDTFREFGKVVDVRINTAKGKTLARGSTHTVPNFGFISFENEESVMKCLEARPIYLNGESRINVGEKKARTNRTMEGNGMSWSGGRGGLRGAMSQGGRGSGIRGGFSRENRGGRGGFSQRR